MKRVKTLLLANMMATTFLLGGVGLKTNEVFAADTNVSLNKKISSFETLDEYYTFQYGGRFGKVDVNKDTKYITDGEASMRMEVWGMVHQGAVNPTMKITLDKSGMLDVSRLKNFTFDLFNETKSESYVELALQISGTVSEYQRYELQTGKNEIKTSFDIIGLGLAFDLTKAEKLVFRFPVAPSYEEGSQQVYYLDNLQMNMSLLPPEPLKITLDEGEFCSFDKAYQKYVTKAEGVGPTTDCLPILTINTDPNYCKGNTGKSLRVELPTGTAPLDDGWPYWTFIDTMYQQLDWTALAAEGKKLVFDIYNTGSNFRFSFEVPAIRNSGARGWSTGIVANHGWTTIEINLADLNSLQTDKDGEYPNALTDHIWMIKFVYNKFAGDAKVFYFDNFRIE